MLGMLAVAVLFQPRHIVWSQPVNPPPAILKGTAPGGIGAACAASSLIGYLDSSGRVVTCVSSLWTVVGASTGVAWGAITGTLSNQTDLQTALNGKAASNASTTVGGTTCSLGSSCTPSVTVASKTCTLGSSCTVASTNLSDSSIIVRTSDTGTVTNTMLAGGIANAKLANAATTVNSQTCTLGSTCTISGTVSMSSPYLTTGGSTYGPIFALTQPPAIGSWTWVNQNGGSANTSNGFLYMQSPQSTGDNYNLLVLSAPATPYTKTAFVNFLFQSSVGIVFRESSSGKFVIFGFSDNGSGGTNMATLKYTNPTTFSAVQNSRTQHQNSAPGIWLRIADDGANRVSSYSLDGINFVQFDTVARTTFLTADQVGVGMNNNSSTSTTSMSVLSWQ